METGHHNMVHISLKKSKNRELWLFLWFVVEKLKTHQGEVVQRTINQVLWYLTSWSPPGILPKPEQVQTRATGSTGHTYSTCDARTVSKAAGAGSWRTGFTTGALNPKSRLSQAVPHQVWRVPTREEDCWLSRNRSPAHFVSTGFDWDTSVSFKTWSEGFTTIFYSSISYKRVLGSKRTQWAASIK